MWMGKSSVLGSRWDAARLLLFDVDTEKVAPARTSRRRRKRTKPTRAAAARIRIKTMPSTTAAMLPPDSPVPELAVESVVWAGLDVVVFCRTADVVTIGTGGVWSSDKSIDFHRICTTGTMAPPEMANVVTKEAAEGEHAQPLSILSDYNGVIGH
jgi:hypothetical protein